MIRKSFTLAAAMLLLSACASPRPHYYTLMPSGLPSSESSAPFQFELGPIGVPAQVDRPQLVVRQGAQGMEVLGNERWVAPLADETRSALALQLAQAMRSQDISGQPANGIPRLRVQVDVRRFESVPGDHTLLETAWSLRTLPGGDGINCSSSLRVPVGHGYDAMVQGHQQALQQLAQQIASLAHKVAAGQHPSCPAG